ncbi:MAG: tetratricopeptide repeat protein [Candidatus Omnitrophota bacterium]
MASKKTLRVPHRNTIARSQVIAGETAKTIWLLAGALILAAVIRLAYLSASRQSPFFEPLLLDPAYYHGWALEILRGQWSSGPVFYGLPLYPCLLSGVYWVSHASLEAVKLVQIAAGLGMVWLVYKTGRQIADVQTGILAAYFAALYGPLFFHEQVLIPEAIGMILYAAAFYLACRFENSPSLRRGALLGLVLGLAALTKAGILVFALLYLTVIGVRFLKSKQPLNAVLLCAAACLLTLLPVTLYNQLHGHDFVPLTSHGGFNFYAGNNPKAEGVFVEPDGVGGNVEEQIRDSRSIAEKQLGRPLKPSEVSAYWSDKAWRFIFENPGDFVKLCAAKTALFFDAREISDVDDYAFSKKFVGFLNGPWPDFALLGPLVFLGIAAAFGRIRHAQITLIWIVAYIGALMFFFVNARYRLPMLSVFLVLAAFGVRELGSRLSRGHWRVAAFYIFVLAAGVVVGQLNLVGTSWARNWVNAGDAYVKMKDYNEALRQYESAIRVEPDSFVANNAMGMILIRMGDYPAAQPYLEKAIRLEPDHASAYTNLGMCHYTRGDGATAKRFFEKALELKSDSAEAHNNLGMLYGNQGRFGEAMRHFEAALAISPRSPRALTNVGLVYYRNGSKDKALRYWNEALSIDPDFPDARKAMRMIGP